MMKKWVATLIALSTSGMVSLPVLSDTMTLDQCLETAFQKNLGLASKQLSSQGKRSTANAALLGMLPSLSMSASASDTVYNSVGGSKPDSYSSSLTLSQTVYQGNYLWSNWKKAELAKDQADLETVRQGRQLTQEIKAAWYAYLESIHKHKEAIEALERLKQHEKNAVAFYQEGRYWRNEVLQAQVEVARGEQKLIEAENTRTLARSTLNQLLRRPLNTELEPLGELAWTPMIWTDLDEANDFALENRSDLHKSKLNKRIGKLTEQTTAYSYYPKVTLSSSMTMSADNLSHEDSTTTGKVMLSASWTPWEWGKTGEELAAARQTTESYNLAYDELVESVMLEVQKAFLTAVEADKKVKVLKKALEQSVENYRVNQVRYREQLGTATDVLDAQDLLTSTRNDYIGALSSYLTALASMDLAVGQKSGADALIKNTEVEQEGLIGGLKKIVEPLGSE
ncbi:MAG: TolC family protein [Magnetococcales bacterium]|nr:TolC family protein [Magnetococcales bacterium]